MKSRSLAVLLASVSLAWSTPASADVVTNWNLITITCVLGAAPSIPAGRGGPTGTIDIALVQAAVHDAVQAIQGRYGSYKYVNRARLGSGSPEAAAAAAAHSMLTGLYGSTLACLNGVPNPATTYPGDPGLQAGYKAADELLRYKRPAFMTERDPFFGGTAPGEWRPAPGVTTGGANVYMGETEPFTLLSPRQFRPEPPPPLDSQHYARDYDEVKRLGSLTGSERTAEQTDLARFWGDFIGQLFRAMRNIADEHLSDVGDTARLFALAALAAADSQITVYETKYHYNFWRPVTAIREGDNDGNPNTVGNPTWTSFVNTPPYPDHSSGANNIAGAITTILQLFFGTDEFDFSVSSTAANLLTNPRTYTRFSQVQEEVVDVRIYQGIHFRFADEDGRQQGAHVGHWVFQKFLRPLPGGKK